MLKDALFYADLGLSVIPIHGIADSHCTCSNRKCNKPGKHPRLKWKSSSKKRLSKSQLKTWWKKFPNSNVGIVTGNISGIAVLDIDGDIGIESLEKAGFDLSKMPVTPTAKTGGGGYHLFFKMSSTAKTKAGILPQVDVRAEGGMVVAPPSLHQSGHIYTWLTERAMGEVEFAEFDFSLLSGKKPSKKKGKLPDSGFPWYELYLSGRDKGLRNDSATRLAGRYFSLGMSKLEVQFMIEAWNKENAFPLPIGEISVIVDSIGTKERSEDKQSIEDSLNLISVILKMQFISVKRISGDEPQYVLTFDEGTCTMTVAQILSPKLFQQAIAEATNILVKKLSSKTIPSHDRMAQLIMSCAEDVDAGIEATSVGEMITLLKDFVRSQKVIPDLDQGDEVPHHGSFRSENLLWMPIEDLVYRGGQKWGMRIPMKSMAQRLRALGINKKAFKLPDGNNKTMWGIDPDSLDKLKEENEWETS